MAKSVLFHRLRRLLSAADQADRLGLPHREWDKAVADPGRRAFLRQAAWGAAGLAGARLLPARSLLQGRRIAQAGPLGNAPVAILGGGAAGLAAAYVLKQAGVRCRVYEGSGRVGGRIFTERNLNADGQFFERGAELVDTNHATLIALATELGLTIEDFPSEPGASGYASELNYVDGRLYSEHEFVEAARPLLAAIAQANREIFGGGPPDLRWDAPHTAAFHRYDRMTMQAFMDAQTGIDPWVKKVVEIAFVCEYGREFSEQSSLNVLTLIGTDPDHFSMFGESDESKRVRGGNDGLIAALKDALTDGKPDEEQKAIAFRHELVGLRDSAGTFACTFRTPDGNVESRAGQIVCALPFSVLRDVDGVDSLDLTQAKRRAIFRYQLGQNSKVVNSFSSRIWRRKTEAHPAFSGAVYADTAVQNFWESSRLQSGERGLLTALLGGRIGLAANGCSIEENVALYDRIFPGAAAAYEGIGLSMNWNKMPFARGSYTCMAPGQYGQFFGAAGTPELGGRMLFAGEHCSVEFTGFMNGAYETGVAAAKAIVERSHPARAA